MPITENWPLEHHQQDTYNYCGPACAQMVLNQIGAGILDQDDLFDTIQANNVIEASFWHSGPDGLTKTLVERRPNGFGNTFVLFEEDQEDKISRKIVWTLHHYQVAPIALVDGLNHWIAVKGYDATAAPRGADDTEYVINAFWINNPWPPADVRNPPSVPPPHSSGDGCGDGGDFGIENEHISSDTWAADYMNGVPEGHWVGKFLAICDPEPPPKRVGRKGTVRRFFDGKRIINKEEAARFALEGLEDYGLRDQEFVRNLLRETRPGEPLLIQRLDKSNSFYYLVPMQNEEKKNLSLVSIDARFANYRQAAFGKSIEKPIIFKPLQKEEILKILGKKIVLKAEKKVLTIHPEAVSIYPLLVWKSCLESLSPYWPFHLVNVGNYRIYIRIDGRIFTRLTTSLYGV